MDGLWNLLILLISILPETLTSISLAGFSRWSMLVLARRKCPMSEVHSWRMFADTRLSIRSPYPPPKTANYFSQCGLRGRSSTASRQSYRGLQKTGVKSLITPPFLSSWRYTHSRSSYARTRRSKIHVFFSGLINCRWYCRHCYSLCRCLCAMTNTGGAETGAQLPSFCGLLSILITVKVLRIIAGYAAVRCCCYPQWQFGLRAAKLQ